MSASAEQHTIEPSTMIPIGWGQPSLMVDKKVFNEVVKMLNDILHGVPLEDLTSRYHDEHMQFVATRFKGWKLPAMLLGIDLPSEAIPLDMEVVQNAYNALLDDRRPH